MKLITIYKLTCLITGLSYIGQTKNGVFKRVSNHITADSLIGEAIRKFEIKNFKIEFLWEAITQKEADIVERTAIFIHNTKNPNGYNKVKGGGGGFEGPHSEKSKRKMSISHIGIKNACGKRSEKTKANMRGIPRPSVRGKNNPMKNPEIAAKVSRANIGKKQSKITKLKRLISFYKFHIKKNEIKL